MTLLAFLHLFEEFQAASWHTWRGILARLTPAVREFYAMVGRGAGKSRIAALLACFFASRAYPRAPGEYIYVGIFAPDRKQARITFRYVWGLLRSVPSLHAASPVRPAATSPTPPRGRNCSASRCGRATCC